MADITFRLPGNAQFSYVEVTLDHQDILSNSPEDTRALLDGALADLNNTYPDIASPEAVQAPQDTRPASSSGHTCAHGERVRKTGTSARGDWVAYFCPSKDKQNQCKPEWVN